MKDSLTINSGKHLLCLKTSDMDNKFFSWRFGNFLGVLSENLVQSHNFFLSMSSFYLHCSHCMFSPFCQFIKLGSELRLQRAQFGIWLTELGSKLNTKSLTNKMCKSQKTKKISLHYTCFAYFQKCHIFFAAIFVVF